MASPLDLHACGTAVVLIGYCWDQGEICYVYSFLFFSMNELFGIPLFIFLLEYREDVEQSSIFT